MQEPRVLYDQPSDTLYVEFYPGESATGIELNDNILLRVNQKTNAAIGLTLFNYSLLAQQTDLGPRSFPLSGLSFLPTLTRDLAIDLLQHSPVRDYLATYAYTPASDATEFIPITTLQIKMLHPRAA